MLAVEDAQHEGNLGRTWLVARMIVESPAADPVDLNPIPDLQLTARAECEGHQRAGCADERSCATDLNVHSHLLVWSTPNNKVTCTRQCFIWLASAPCCLLQGDGPSPRNEAAVPPSTVATTQPPAKHAALPASSRMGKKVCQTVPKTL